MSINVLRIIYQKNILEYEKTFDGNVCIKQKLAKTIKGYFNER